MYTERKKPTLTLKLGVPRGLFMGRKVSLDKAPIKRDGVTLVPKSALALLGIETDSEYTALSDVKGILSLENEMGLIFFDSEPITLTVKNDTPFMLDLAHDFIFEVKYPLILAKDYAPASEMNRFTFTLLGKEVRELLKKRNNTHPFLFGNKDIFDKLRAIYNAKDGSDVYNHLVALVKRADEYRAKYPELNEAGDGLKESMPSSGYGETEYDVGGRHSDSESVFTRLAHEAFAYQITLDESYAKHTYYCAIEICDRLHWGPGHFLNCSGAAGRLAMIYDWSTTRGRRSDSTRLASRTHSTVRASITATTPQYSTRVTSRAPSRARAGASSSRRTTGTLYAIAVLFSPPSWCSTTASTR